MTTPFYTAAFQRKDQIHHYYVDKDGKRQVECVKYKPHLAVRTKKPGRWKDMFGNYTAKIEFGNIFEMYAWKKENEHSDIYDDVIPTNQFIVEKYPDALDPDFTKVVIHNIDIECDSGPQGQFPHASEAAYPVTAITVHDMTVNVYHVFGTQPYTPKKPNVKYYEFPDEETMMMKFIDFMERERPDIITGWNVQWFDIPYIVNRCKIILPGNYYANLSPVGIISLETDRYTKETSYKITGVAIIDYMRMYKMPKFQPVKQPSYSLNNIALVELGEEKVDYHQEYGSIRNLYRENYELFIDYNIRDTELVYLLNQKLRLLEIAMTMAYTSKCNFEDVFGSVKLWEILIYNEMQNRQLSFPPKQKNITRSEFPGGYVLEPEPGMKEWLTVWDIASSYPNQIISFNLSPESLIPYSSLPGELKQLKAELGNVDDYLNIDTLERISPILKKYKVSMSANGEFFRSDKQGIFSEIVQKMFKERKQRKANAGVLYNELQTLKDELKELEK